MARISAALLFCVTLVALADEPPEATPEFKPPPGFKPKKHGDVILYCRREAVLGSRFSAVKCYDEAGLHAIKVAELEQKEILERIRACGASPCAAN